jgi:hypothetical protein
MKKIVLVVIVAVVAAGLAIGLTAAAPYIFTMSTSSQNGGSGQTLQASQTTYPYDCALPANSSMWNCATLPSGYKIAPKLPGAPQAVCPSQMSAAACQLYQQTYGNGVCDPNETSITAPLDCSCPGATTPDWYTGRCAAPATVCQAAAQAEISQLYNSTKP